MRKGCFIKAILFFLSNIIYRVGKKREKSGREKKSKIQIDEEKETPRKLVAKRAEEVEVGRKCEVEKDEVNDDDDEEGEEEEGEDDEGEEE